MVISDEFLGGRCTLSDIDEGRPYPLRPGSWRLMYPEVTFEDDLLRPESNSASRSHHEAVTSRSNDHLGKNPPITNDEDEQLLPTVRLRSFSCSPSTSSESSSEDVIVVNIRTPQAHEAKSKFKDSGYIAFSTSYGSEEQSSSRPAELQASDITHQSLWQGQSPMHGPKIQLMERDAEYEPHRIPSSVFVTGDSTTPAEWSAASNESLFSIHFGNSSFGSKRPITPSRELTKSGELLMFSPSLPSTEENCNEEIAASHEEKVMAADRTQKDIGKIYPVDQNEVKPPAAVEAVRSCGVSRHSNDSEGSACSFAFPIKTCCKKKCLHRRKKCSCSSCYCSNCSCAFCRRKCKWPGCLCRWPSCFYCCCSCAFCHRPNCSLKRFCWNCNLKRLCCFSTTILAPRRKDSATKADASQQWLSEAHSGVVSKAPASSKCSKGCFSCFSCRFFCCCCCRSCCSCPSCSSC